MPWKTKMMNNITGEMRSEINPLTLIINNNKGNNKNKINNKTIKKEISVKHKTEIIKIESFFIKFNHPFLISYK